MARHGVALALLAVFLSASGASAACTSGSFTADLFSAGGGACDANPFAKCLSSFTVTAGSAAAGCGITLTPLAASGVTIPALWTASSSGSYAKYVSCPTSALTTTVGDAASLADILAAAKDVLNSALWATAVTEVAADPTVATGVLSYTAATCALQYRITSSTGITGAEAAACDGVTGCETASDCAAGKYAVAVSGLVKTCALCPPGEPLRRGGAALPACAALLCLPCSALCPACQTKLSCSLLHPRAAHSPSPLNNRQIFRRRRGCLHPLRHRHGRHRRGLHRLRLRRLRRRQLLLRRGQL